MTMDVEVDQPEGEEAEHIDKEQIVDFLTNNDNIFFKSQQIGEDDLSKQEKTEIALEVYNKSKLNFLIRFGRYMQQHHLGFFQQFTQGGDDSNEISVLLKELYKSLKEKRHISVRNRRYEALKCMISEDSYFSEIEMMKRNPLLYEQLVGQYLTQDEKAERDKFNMEKLPTLSKILLEGIERDDAKIKQKEQEEYEDNIMEEDDDSEEKAEMEVSSDEEYSHPTCSQWGEFKEPEESFKKPKRSKRLVKITDISIQERKLLREEFVSLMYQNFLDGKDEDFDYESVDNNIKYDNTEMTEHDEEDKYFDSEEPETIEDCKNDEESEDELDIYMSALNRNPAVMELSKDIQKL